MKKLLTTIIIALCAVIYGNAQRATVPFFENFTPETPGVWTLGTLNGTVFSGFGGLESALEFNNCCLGGVEGEGFADLAMDLSTASGPLELGFKYGTVGDCFTRATDGIYISDDNGNTFRKAFDLPAAPTATSFPVIFVSESIDLTSFALANNLSLNDQIIIRFRTYVGYTPDCLRGVFFDDVKIDTSCPENIDLNSPLSSASLSFQSSNQIAASSTIENGSNLTLDAGNQVLLLPGFHAKAGNVVNAKIGGCQPAVGGRTATSQLNASLGHLQQAKVYPNPNNGVFTLSFDTNQEPAQVTVYSLLGKVVYSRLFEGGNVEVDISAYPKDIYTLRVSQGSEVVFKKIILQ